MNLPTLSLYKNTKHTSFDKSYPRKKLNPLSADFFSFVLRTHYETALRTFGLNCLFQLRFVFLLQKSKAVKPCFIVDMKVLSGFNAFCNACNALFNTLLGGI